MDAHDIREMDRRGLNNPEAGLNDVDDEVLGTDRYQDPVTDRDIHPTAAKWMGDRKKIEGGATTEGMDPEGVKMPSGTSLIRDERGAGMSEDRRTGF